MKASDLRIGSLVDVIDRGQLVHTPFGVVKKVGLIEFFKVSLYDADKPFATQAESWTVDIADLSPIPLNEEWLLKFGFIQDTDPDCKEWFNLERFHIRMDEPNSGFFYSGGDHASGGNADAIVQYVHQLQNLYHSLTGNELTH